MKVKMPNTNIEIELILESMIMRINDAMRPEKTNLRFSNQSTVLCIDEESHPQPYVKVSYSCKASKHGDRIHDEIIYFTIDKKDEKLALIDIESDLNLVTCDDDYLQQVNDEIIDIISENKNFAKIAMSEIMTLTRVSKIDSLEKDDSLKEEYFFKSIGRLQKHIKLNGIIDQFTFNNKVWKLHEKSSQGEFTSFVPTESSVRGKIVVSTSDFNGILGYSDARVRLIA